MGSLRLRGRRHAFFFVSVSFWVRGRMRAMSGLGVDGGKFDTRVIRQMELEALERKSGDV